MKSYLRTRTVYRTYLPRSGVRRYTRLSVSQRLTILRRMCESFERLAGGLSAEALTPSDRRRLKTSVISAQRELRWLLLAIGEPGIADTEKAASQRR